MFSLLTYSVVIDVDILLISGLDFGFLCPFDNCAMSGVLHIVLSLGQKQFFGGSFKVLLSCNMTGAV